jgi:hypothetical protein
MVRWQHADTLLEKVRVFTFVLNAQELSVRMHRATLHEVTLLQYHFVELVDLTKHSNDQAFLLVGNILDKHTIEELHSILSLAFNTVTKERNRTIEGDRRSSCQRATAARRAQSRGTSRLAEEQTSSFQFGISGLSTRVD